MALALVVLDYHDDGDKVPFDGWTAHRKDYQLDEACHALKDGLEISTVDDCAHSTCQEPYGGVVAQKVPHVLHRVNALAAYRTGLTWRTLELAVAAFVNDSWGGAAAGQRTEGMGYGRLYTVANSVLAVEADLAGRSRFVVVVPDVVGARSASLVEDSVVFQVRPQRSPAPSGR